MASNSSPVNDAQSSMKASPSNSNTNSNHLPAQGASRETCESIAFAFVLALVFRTFAAEAFVIPTGSMAPTLLGRNKAVVCPSCQFGYDIGASEELDENGVRLMPGQRIQQSVCPNCRHMHSVKELNVFKGDRILVNKAAYQFGELKRWDVVVFRYPEDTQKNYIKRLVGLPNESILIEHGDVYVRTSEKDEYRIIRKDDPNKQKLIQLTVHDDRHAPTKLLEKGWPESWQPMTRTGAADGVDGWVTDSAGWTRDDSKGSRKLSVSATNDSRWIRFQNFAPSEIDWGAVEQGNSPAPNPRPQLISDYCGYNTYTGGRGGNIDDDRYWVGDLTVNCTATITSISGADARLILELVEGVRRYRCTISLPSGVATLTRNDDLAADPNEAPEIVMAKAQTSITGPGTYSLRFSNVDDRLCLWVNDTSWRSGLVTFGPGAEFDRAANHLPQDADLTPVGIASQGLAMSVSDLHVERDIYYRADSVPNDAGLFGGHDSEVADHLPLRDLLDNPREWSEMYSKNVRRTEFPKLNDDEFFVMGDNSPRSQDSRLWPNNVRRDPHRHAVKKAALIGKAFFVYWPHGIPFLNGGKGFQIKGHRVPPGEGRDWEEARADAAGYPEWVVPFYPQWWRWQRIR